MQRWRAAGAASARVPTHQLGCRNLLSHRPLRGTCCTDRASRTRCVDSLRSWLGHLDGPRRADAAHRRMHGPLVRHPRPRDPPSAHVARRVPNTRRDISSHRHRLSDGFAHVAARPVLLVVRRSGCLRAHQRSMLPSLAACHVYIALTVIMIEITNDVRRPCCTMSIAGRSAARLVHARCQLHLVLRLVLRLVRPTFCILTRRRRVAYVPLCRASGPLPPPNHALCHGRPVGGRRAHPLALPRDH
jgi:hypothetical protein